MLKTFSKLIRKLMMLAILSGSLIFVLGMHTSSTKAFAPKCCWECDNLAEACDTICDVHPQGCATCMANVTTCYAICNPDPMCAH